MKSTLISIVLIAFAIPCSAQWKDDDFYNPVLAFGVHDTSFFIGVDTVGNSANLVYRYAPGTPHTWIASETGMDATQGNVTSFASLGNYFFAGMTSGDGPGTAWRSTDNGGHWIANAGGFVCSNGTYVFGVSDGIYQTKDSGNTNTWQKVTTFQASCIAAMGSYIFATAANGIWRSADSGNVNTWSLIPTPITGSMTVMDSLLFILRNGELVKSTDSGSHWGIVTADSAGTSKSVQCLATDGKHLFAGTSTGILVSNDTGAHWQAFNQGLTYPNIYILGVFDTLLFAEIQNVGQLEGHALYVRSIPEMLADTGPASVVSDQPSDSIEIYPNPASETVTILGMPIFGITVTNVLGNTILSRSATGESSIALDLSNEPSGTYFLAIQTQAGISLKKVTIER
jgi:hypothetical protein